MTRETIPFADLTQSEQLQFTLWSDDIASIAEKSVSASLRRSPPKLVVTHISLNTPYAATTDGAKFWISQDLLPVASGLRRYFVAHELGHCEGHHPWITFWSAMFFFFGGVGLALFGRVLHSWAGSTAVALACFVTLAGLAIIFAQRKTMYFEWDADRRAARMIGLQPMLNGITLVNSLRGVTSNAFYLNKRSRLQDQPASIWTPPL